MTGQIEQFLKGRSIDSTPNAHSPSARVLHAASSIQAGPRTPALVFSP